MKNPNLICGLLFLLLPFVFSGCQQQEKNPNKLIIGLSSNPLTFDPRLGTDVTSSRIGQLLFNSLVIVNAQGQLEPDLADNWEMPTPRSYRFHLKKNVRFHDGRELKASDVAYTFNSLLEPALNSPKKAILDMVENIVVEDAYTLTFNLKEVFSPFLLQLVVGILPAPDNQRSIVATDAQPIGTGPFKLKSFAPEERIVLERFSDYFEGQPLLEELEFRIIPDDNIRAMTMEKGEIEFLQNDLSNEAIQLFSQDKTKVVVRLPSTTIQYIGFNLAAQSPIAQQAIRQAIAYSIDRQKIIDHLLSGLAVKARSILPETHWAYNPAVPAYEYNPDKARALLDAAGFSDPDGSGPELRCKINFKCSEIKKSKQLAEVFQQDLRKVGIDLRIASFEWATFYDDIIKGNFESYSLNWVGITDPDMYYSIFHSSMKPPKGRNRGNYVNQVLDGLVEQARTLIDREEAKNNYAQVQTILAEELPYINLWHLTNIVVHPVNLEGFVPSPSGDLMSLKKARLR